MAAEGLFRCKAVLKQTQIGLFAALIAVSPAPTWASPTESLPTIEVFAPAPCLACIDWATHLRKHKLQVVIHEKSLAELATIKRRLKVPAPLESRHTATAGSHFIEGHVPVEDILELLRDQPKARGIAVPGLPRGAPGLELTSPVCETACTMLDNDSGVRDIKRELYDTLLVLPDGSTKIWARH